VATDIDGLAALLRDDVRCSMPPTPGLYVGRDAVLNDWVESGFEGMKHLRAVLTSVNRQPAVAFYQWREREGAYLPLTMDVLRVTGGTITEIVTFHDDQFPRLGLPERLPADDTGVVAGLASGQTSHTHRLRGLAVTGFVSTLAAMVATTLAAALAQAVGVDFEVPDAGETIPLSGFAVVTGFFSVVGIVIAVALLHWSARPAERFVWTAVSLTAISLVPPLLSGANTATTTALLGLHLLAAAVMIPTLARSLRTRTN
jgi:hypothetical protein